MEIQQKEVNPSGIKFYVAVQEREIARAYLYILTNDLHPSPFGFMEDVFVDESLRGSGYGTSLVERIIEEAMVRGCYKLICTSRHGKDKVHGLYEKLGFVRQGLEFRIDF